ncbi:MAG: VCBS repeat-containing protein [Agriterribacter sp.]
MFRKQEYIIVFFYTVLVMIGCKSKPLLFEKLSSDKTNIHFTNTLENRKAFGILYYLYYYNGGGVSVGDINNDGLPDIYFTANSKGNNKLYLNKGNFEFEDITDKAGVAGTSDWCSGVTMADVNGDGFLDIYVSAVANHHGLKGRNELFINSGNTKDVGFKEEATAYGLDFSGFTTQAAFFDYDKDGDLDCYLLNQSHKPNENIVDTNNRRKFDANAGDRLYRNNLIHDPADTIKASTKFTDVSAHAGIYQSSLGYGLGLAIGDFNNDGWDDIYVGNDFHENDYYYLNNGNGSFIESGAAHFEHYSRFSMGNDAADFNNDGQLDIITVDMLPPDEKILKTYGSDENPDIYRYKLMTHGFQYQYSKNCLQRNNGNGKSFSEVALAGGVSATDWSWSPLFVDFDNDGNKDLFVSSGIVKRPVDLDYVRFVSNLYMHKALNSTDQYDDMAMEKMPDGTSHPFLFKGDGKLKFEDMSKQWGTENLKGYSNGAAYADLDNDGNVDMVVNCLNAPAMILKNNAPEKKYISLSFKGEKLNTSGIGTKVWLFQNGQIQYQQLMLTRGFQSSSDSRLHFGVDTAKSIDSLLIVWPDQQFEIIKNIPSDTALVVAQKNASNLFNYQQYFSLPQPLFVNKTDSIVCNWKHKENNFFDFNVQYLIPHAQSTRGPKIAVADVDGDGLDDFYACGAKGQPGTLMVQQKDGNFSPSDTALWNADAMMEDVDAVFFDANADGQPDLYVASGGNEYKQGDDLLKDRLYINNGNGRFLKSAKSLPDCSYNKSSVSVADVDGDGDPDIFCGTLADAHAFGVPQTSHLLINNKSGQFSIAPKNIIDLDSIGIVTASAFADLNNDGWMDLVVAGEWMPVILFINEKGKFKRKELPASSGLWQTVFVQDVNGDGNIDILAGNWGYNNKFHSGKNGPVRLYVSDFDKNKKVDQLLSYTANDIEYPFLAKDEVERPLPLLKKHYLMYAEYAGVSMKEVFYGWIDNVKPYTAEQLGSAIFYGNGKGDFNRQALPDDLQLAPVFSFQQISTGDKNTFIAGGNFFDVIPYEGRYDAQPLGVFSVDKKNKTDAVAQPDLSSIKGQVRDIKWINHAKYGKLMVVARNNEPLLFFKQNN